MAVAATGGLAAGCASPDSGIQPGEHVTVYVSMPLRGPEAANGHDVVDGAKLALSDSGGRAGKLRVRAVYLDDTLAEGGGVRWSGAAAAANARRAAEDSTAIAFVGDFDSGASRFSLPVTNGARVLQVSPASAAVDLAQPFLGGGGQLPEDVQPTGERTFGRVIPSDEVQAQAGAVWAKRLGARQAIVASDRSSFGQLMRAAFDESARTLGMRAEGGGLGGLFARPATRDRDVSCPTQLTHPATTDLIYSAGATPPAGLTGACAGAVRPRLGVMASDALLRQDALATLGASPTHPLRITSAAQDPSQLPASGQRFVQAFRGRYGRRTGRYGAYGYEAMAVVLDSIRRAGDSGDDRDSVVDAFFDTRDRESVLGTYSIDEVGNTTLGRLSGYRLERQQAKVVAGLEVSAEGGP